MVFDQRQERNTTRYRKMRRAFLRQNPLCAMCVDEGIIRHADEMDHIVPVSDAPDRMYDWDNLQALCSPHHVKKTAGENSSLTDEREEWIERLATL